eukprot:10391102-Alexandrium_andersonii.AAC.1
MTSYFKVGVLVGLGPALRQVITRSFREKLITPPVASGAPRAIEDRPRSPGTDGVHSPARVRAPMRPTRSIRWREFPLQPPG